MAGPAVALAAVEVMVSRNQDGSVLGNWSDETVAGQLSDIHNSRDYFFQELLMEECQQLQTCDYVKTDFLTASGKWRGSEVQAYLDQKGRAARRVFVGHSDKEIGFRIALRFFLGGRKQHWSATNLSMPFWLARFFHLEPLPLGLTNPTNETPLHKVFGDMKQLAEAFDVTQVWTEKTSFHAYANFSVRNGRKWREVALREVAESVAVKHGSFDPSPRGRAKYLRELQLAGWVLCPRGNGHDTHRFYETLYMGALPVVKRHSYSHRLSRKLELPALVLDRWSDVLDKKKMERKMIKLKRRNWDYSQLRGSFWLHEARRSPQQQLRRSL